MIFDETGDKTLLSLPTIFDDLLLLLLFSSFGHESFTDWDNCG